MADIKRLVGFIRGANRGFDLTADSLMMNSLKLTTDGGSTSSELTKAILDNLISLQDGSDISAALHHHDGRYYTETELGSNANGAGASLIGIEDASSQFTGTNVEAALDEAMDAAQAAQADATQALSDAAAAQGDIDSHTNATVEDKHSAEQIGMVTAGNYYLATDHVDDALEKVDAQVNTNATNIALKANDADVIKKDGSVAFTGDQSMGGFKLTNLAAPVSANDAARLTDVQAAQAGQFPKAPVDLVSLSNITLTGEQTIDGVLTSSSRVLVAGQTDATENGIYISNSGAWTRATDADGTPSSEIKQGNTVLVLSGNNANIIYVLNATDAVDPQAISAGTEEQEWIIYSRAETILASTGLERDGNVIKMSDAALSNGIQVSSGAISIGLDTDPGLEFNSNALRVKIKASSGLVRDADGLSVNLGDFDTDDLSEGASNFYYTEGRFDSSFSGKDSADLNHTQGDTNDWTIGDGSSIAGHLDELADRTSALEAQGGNESMIETMVLGEAIGSAGLYCVRMAKSGETAGKVYLADRDASTKDNFNVIGLISLTAAAAIDDNVVVYKAGKMVPDAAHGLTVGEKHYLGDSGAIIDGGAEGANIEVGTAGYTESDAAKPVCIARSTTDLEVYIEQGFVF